MRVSRGASPGTVRGRRARPAGPGRASDLPAGGAASRPELLRPEPVLALQRQVGNSAVARLLKPAPPRSVQRAPLSVDEDPERYTEAAGKQNVAGSGTTRREVRGLKYGVVGGFKERYKGRKGERRSAEARMTKESPDNMAVVVMPDRFEPARPAQVILHFHGWGFRGGTDPYAGYLVASGARRGSPKRGTVRDVDQEHWEQQIGAVEKERAKRNGPQIVAILAQGRGMSDFGNVPTFDYVQDVLSRVPELKGMTHYSIVLSAHSGGGSTQVAPMVGRGDAQTADRAKLAAQKPGKAPNQPADLVVLFDAEGVESVMSWVLGQLAALMKEVKAAATPADAQAAIAATPKFRGYFAERGFYAKRYERQNNRLCAALAKVPDRWARPDPGDPKAVKVSDLFRIIQVSGPGVDHEHVISGGTGHPAEEGSLADALRASQDPTGDRDEAFPCTATDASRKAPSPKADAKTVPATAPKTAPKTAPTTTPTSGAERGARAWTASDATSQYALTEADKQLLGSQTSDERAEERAKLDKKAMRRLAALAKAKKKGALEAGEEQELAELQALKTRIETTQRALKRKDVEEVLAKAGYRKVSEWYGDIRRGAFLGISLRVHRALAERLAQAEAALVGDPKVNPTKLDAAALGERLKMYASTSDLRKPKAAVGGSSLSLHTFGLAVDLNYSGNPFIGNASKLAPEVVRRATSLVNGTAIDVMTDIGDPKAAYATLRTASDALKAYFSYRDPAKLAELTEKVKGHAPAKGEPTDAPTWLEQIRKDHKALDNRGDFANHKAPEQGFLDFNEAVVLALTDAGLTWGGTYKRAKDVMHFDLREGEGAKVNAARNAHRANR
jgi:hypothetical protein